MDISKFNSRKFAEDGVFVSLRDPYSGQLLGEDEKTAPGFIVRGIASKTVQRRMAEMQKAAKETQGDDRAAMEALHENMIESALGYIIKARNLENDGKEVQSRDDIRAVLDMTFPDMQIAKGEDGKPLTQEIEVWETPDGKDANKGDDGAVRRMASVPRFELANEPFAQQIIKAAEEGQRFLGKTSKG